MTTIAYKDGVMASDTRAYAGSALNIGAKQKIHQFNDGTLVGVTTTCVGISERFVQYVRNGSRVEEQFPINDKGFTALVVDPLGQVFFYDDGFYPSGPLQAGYFAIGSGAHYALAAMHCGCTALEAVEVGIEFDVWSEYPTMTVGVAPKKSKRRKG